MCIMSYYAENVWYVSYCVKRCTCHNVSRATTTLCGTPYKVVQYPSHLLQHKTQCPQCHVIPSVVYRSMSHPQHMLQWMSVCAANCQHCCGTQIVVCHTMPTHSQHMPQNLHVLWSVIQYPHCCGLHHHMRNVIQYSHYCGLHNHMCSFIQYPHAVVYTTTRGVLYNIHTAVVYTAVCGVLCICSGVVCSVCIQSMWTFIWATAYWNKQIVLLQKETILLQKPITTHNLLYKIVSIPYIKLLIKTLFLSAH